MRQYRLIYDMPTAGNTNMAVDEAIMSCVAAGESLPTLRLYGWNPPCLSLGYGQSIHDVDLELLQKFGYDIVRRPTGGRAILHTDELTYSLTVPEGHPLAEGSIVESYRRISQALLKGLEYIGLHPQADKQVEKLSSGPVCFETPSHYEITTSDGRKLIGSAQLRRKGAVLQHGSLPLYGDVARICNVLDYQDEHERLEAKDKVRKRAATLADAFNGEIIPWEAAADALVRGFIDAFDAYFVEDAPTSREYQLVEELVSTVYGNPAYTQRR